jgi:serine/threonine protein kinase
MNSDRWNLLSAWLTRWAAADEEGRARLRAQLAADHPDLVAEAESLARASGRLGGFLETPALVLEARTIATEDPILPSGVEVGPYRIAGLLARGGTGDVYRATDTRLRRDVALKVLSHTRTSDPHRVERFIHEARLTASLDHANVVRVFDVGRTTEHTYLVAELLEGETLRARVERGAIPVDDVLRIALEIANGLAAAHEAGLVHRDLKPDNIFLTRSGVTKILDFGIAKLAEGEVTGDGFATMTGVVLGTAGYLAPEQIRGQHVDARADLFALGTVLFEMLTGVRAFGREHMVETLHAILHDPPSAALAQRSDVPPTLSHIVMRLLEKSPEVRFESAEEVISALRHVDVREAPLKKRVRPHAWWAAGVLIAAVIVLASTIDTRKWIGQPATSSPNERAMVPYRAGRAIVLRPDPDNLRKAARYFQDAIDIDAGFADAWAGLATARKRMPITGAADPNVAFPEVLEAAQRALDLDPVNAEAFAAQGTVAFWYEWDYAKAEGLLEKALSIDANHADSHMFLAHVYSNTDRPRDALFEIRRAQELAHEWPQPRALEGLFLYQARRYDEAVRHLDTVVKDLDPTLWTAQLFRAPALFLLGRYEDSLNAIPADVKFPHPHPLAFRGYVLARMNRTAEAEAALAALPSTGASYQRALVLYGLGRNEAALDELRRAIDDKLPHVTFLGVDPIWDALRGSERFRQLAKRVNLLEVSDQVRERYK